jgi:hypothetical protein
VEMGAAAVVVVVATGIARDVLMWCVDETCIVCECV